MCADAQAEGLVITGHVADITTYTPDGVFDIVLVDRTLHMLAPEPRRTTLLQLMQAVAAGGWLVIADETSNLPAFKTQLLADARGWTIERCGKGYLFAQVMGERPKRAAVTSPS